MAKSKPTRSKSSTPAAPRRERAGQVPTVDGLRSLDRQLLELLNRRAEWYRQLHQPEPAGSQAGTSSVAAGQPPASGVDDARYWEELGELVAASRGPLSPVAVQSVFRELLSGCRSLVQPARVAYLGPPYSYSHLAALERFGQSADLVPVATIPAVFEALARGQAAFGLVPIENSTDGRVVDTLDMFARQPARICGEVQLRIHHCLLGKCSRSEVQEVYSKPQALSQCRAWLARHLPGARTVEMASTASAAKLAGDRPFAAAIASRQAGAHYGLDVIEANIEDNRHNVTRFAVIGEVENRRTGDDKTCLMFELRHQPGALADAMVVFKRNRLNLTWIESFPRPDTPREYVFFVELEGHGREAKVKRALSSLQEKTDRLIVLGSYARCQPIEA
ncbi:MAG: prephenate dehydratase [Pirellulaceae bacterium]|nr:prephenate dehydratase [Pirellulaceae bacterium]